MLAVSLFICLLCSTHGALTGHRARCSLLDDALYCPSVASIHNAMPTLYCLACQLHNDTPTPQPLSPVHHIRYCYRTHTLMTLQCRNVPGRLDRRRRALLRSFTCSSEMHRCTRGCVWEQGPNEESYQVQGVCEGPHRRSKNSKLHQQLGGRILSPMAQPSTHPTVSDPA